MVNFGPLPAEIGPVVWGTPVNFNGFRVLGSWQRYCTVLQQWASAKLCGVEQRAPHIFCMAVITLGISHAHSSFFFFLAYSQPSHIGCLPFFHTWFGLSANLECRCEMCCTRLAENTRRKNRQKFAIWGSGHHRTTLSGCIFATEVSIDNRKNLLNSNISSTCPTISLRPTTG